MRTKTDRMVGPEYIAELLGVPVATVYWWPANSKPQPAHRIGRHTRYWLSDVLAWIERHQVSVAVSED